MNRAELVEVIAQEVGISKAAALRTVETIKAQILSQVAKGNNVTLVGLGTFTKKTRAARKGVNPATGEKIKIAAKTIPLFKPGQAFKDAVNSKRKAKK